jgi:cytochrome P450
LIGKAFAPRVINRLKPHIEEIAHDLLDQIQESNNFDVIADYAYPLPVVVIAELLGVPASDRGLLKKWSPALVAGCIGDVLLDVSATARKTLSAHWLDIRACVWTG